MTGHDTVPMRRSSTALLLAFLSAATWGTAPPARAQADGEGPVVLEGAAAAAHPVGRAAVEAARLLAEGRLAEVKAGSVREVREEWEALSPEEQRDESELARSRAPEPSGFARELARTGVLTLYGESASLQLPTPDGGDVAAMVFAGLEDGEWRVTGGPISFEPTPVQTAPSISGEDILEHEIGRLALEYARRLSGGDVDGALDLLSGPARAKRAAESAEERRASDEFRLGHLPPPDVLAEWIRDGGTLSFADPMAYLSVVSTLTSRGDDGSVTSTSTSISLPFELHEGAWTIGD